MATKADLRYIACERLDEALLLLAGNKPDGAHYICGYAVECALKYGICKVLRWDSYPPADPTTGTESFKNIDSFKTHSPQTLLLLSGKLRQVYNEAALLAAWNNVKDWNSEVRYERSQRTQAEVRSMIRSAIVILNMFGIRPNVTVV